MRRHRRALGALLAAAIGLELVYLFAGNWWLWTQLERLGIHARQAFTLYPGDLRAGEFELTAAGGAMTVRGTGLRGQLELRSLFSHTWVLSSVTAQHIDAEVKDVARSLRALRRGEGPPTRRLAAMSLGLRRLAPSALQIERFRARLGSVKVQAVSIPIDADVELGAVVSGAGLSSLDVTVRARRLELARGSAEAAARFAGQLRLEVRDGDQTAEGASPPAHATLRVELRGGLENMRALLGYGPALRLAGVELTIELETVGTRVSARSFVLLHASKAEVPTQEASANSRSEDRAAAVMLRGAPLDIPPASDERLALTFSGRGDDAGLILALIDAPPAARLMFDELNGQRFTFSSDISISSVGVRAKRLKVSAPRVQAEGEFVLSDGGARGALLLRRGGLAVGILLNEGQSQVVGSPEPDWLGRALEMQESGPVGRQADAAP